ncbi:hypothetical protein HDV05_001427, partial [Chytridiales sp. JEL 0842]
MSGSCLLKEAKEVQEHTIESSTEVLSPISHPPSHVYIHPSAYTLSQTASISIHHSSILISSPATVTTALWLWMMNSLRGDDIANFGAAQAHTENPLTLASAAERLLSVMEYNSIDNEPEEEEIPDLLNNSDSEVDDDLDDGRMIRSRLPPSSEQEAVKIASRIATVHRSNKTTNAYLPKISDIETWLNTTYRDDPYINEGRLIRFFFDDLLKRPPKKRGRKPKGRSATDLPVKKSKKAALLDVSVVNLTTRLKFLEDLPSKSTRVEISDALKNAGAPASLAKLDIMIKRVEDWKLILGDAIEKRRAAELSFQRREDEEEVEEGEGDPGEGDAAVEESSRSVQSFEELLRQQPTETQTEEVINTEIIDYLARLGYFKATLAAREDMVTMQAIQLSLSSLKQYVCAAVELYNTQRT